MGKRDLGYKPKKMSSYEMRGAVELAKKSIRLPIKKEEDIQAELIYPMEYNTNQYLAESDILRRAKNYKRSVEMLGHASRTTSLFTKNEQDKYEKAIEKRAYRILNDLEHGKKKGTLKYARAAVAILTKLEERRKERGKSSKLEKSLGMGAVITFFTGLFFLFFNLTGNVIGQTSRPNSNFIGAIFIIFSFLCGFFYLRKNSLIKSPKFTTAFKR